MKKYELLYIVSPTVLDQDIDKLVDQVNNHITSLGGQLGEVENLGRRQLTYEIKHHREGTYILARFQSPQGREIPELERRLRVMDNILRYLTVNLDPDLRRMDRMRQKRARRKESRATSAAAGEKTPPEQAFPEDISKTEGTEEE